MFGLEMILNMIEGFEVMFIGRNSLQIKNAFRYKSDATLILIMIYLDGRRESQNFQI